MILDPITGRRAHFSFSGEPVAQEILLELFEAATLAPSSGNNQPWRYFYGIKGTKGFEALFDCLDDGNRRWTKNAGALILSAAQVKYVYKDKEITNALARHDTGLANALLMIQGVFLGLKTHPMGGFYPDKARKAADLSTDLEPVAMIAIGYAGDETTLPDDLLRKQRSPRNRRPVGEIANQL